MDKKYFNIKSFFRNVKLKRYIAVVFACGILILSFSEKLPNEKSELQKETEGTDTKETELNSFDSTEKRLEEIFSQIEGAGKVKVMITYKSGAEKVFATETKNSEENNEESDREGKNKVSKSISSEVKMAYSSETVSGGKPIVVKENTPEIEGIVVVAQGGGNVLVKESISKAAQALFNVHAHKVEVLKMEE